MGRTYLGESACRDGLVGGGVVRGESCDHRRAAVAAKRVGQQPREHRIPVRHVPAAANAAQLSRTVVARWIVVLQRCTKSH